MKLHLHLLTQQHAYTTYLKGGSNYDIWAQGVTGRVIGVGAATLTTSFDQGQCILPMVEKPGQFLQFWILLDLDFNKLSMVDTLTGYAAREDHMFLKQLMVEQHGSLLPVLLC